MSCSRCTASEAPGWTAMRIAASKPSPMTDVIGEGFDAAIRIAVQPGASLAVQRLHDIPRYLVGSPAYLDKHGRPKHPLHLTEHRCICYSYTMAPEIWRFTMGKKSASVRPSG